MGSAVLFFSLAPERAILSDINSDLINAFIAVKEHPRAVYNRLTDLPRGKRAYYKIRAESTKGYSLIDKAVRFIYLNRFCFNGIYRTNLVGKFNVPYGGNNKAYLPTLDDLQVASRVLQSAKLMAGDFEEVIKKGVRKGDFVYMDPPYAQDNKEVFHQYRPNEFGLQDLCRIKDALDLIEERGAYFLLSYGLCPEATKLFKHWPHRKLMVQRNIAGFVESRRRAAELLVTNIPDAHWSYA